MPFEHIQDSRGPSRHGRSRSDKGSSDSLKTRGPKPPSQKAMLSKALQKANAAVQLDNGQDVWGAREAYGEACELLQQVLQRTSAQEDKRKLEAIQRTYTSRIDELDQMLPSISDSKALPDFPDEYDTRHNTVYRYSAHPVPEQSRDKAEINWDLYNNDSHFQAARQLHQAHGPYAQQPSEPGLLQSSFSRSPLRSRFPDNVSHVPTGDHILPQGQQQSSAHHFRDDIEGPIRSDFSTSRTTRSDPRRGLEHSREDSQNSWLDPIDESGGSTASSVHSRTSSLGYRRRHIRSGSGDTEAEFDTALDAAIEAAYDEGYEPVGLHEFQRNDPDEEVVANALRKVELARERVRQTEREAYEMASERERERFQLLPQQQPYAQQHHNTLGSLPGSGSEDFFDDNSSDEEERMLEEITRDFNLQSFSTQQQPQTHPSVPRESDSSGFTSRTWQSSIGSNPSGTGLTSLSTVTESSKVPVMPQDAPPAVPGSAGAPSEVALNDAAVSQTVRGRRLSGLKRKHLKIETAGISPRPYLGDEPAHAHGTPSAGQKTYVAAEDSLASVEDPSRTMSPAVQASPFDGRVNSPFSQAVPAEIEDSNHARSGSPSVAKLKKNFSSSSLRSLRGRNASVSQFDDGGDMSPGTPSSSHWSNSRAPAIPAIPTTVAAGMREKVDISNDGMYVLDDSFHSPNRPGSPNQSALDAPVALEPCPTDFMLRPFWLMRCLYQTLVHPRGGYLSSKLFIPKDAWRVKGVKLRNLEDKIANCDFLTAALLKLAKVDTCDADAMLEEMQSLESVLEQVQGALSRKLGNEVGVQSSGAMFKEASGVMDGDGALPRSASTSAKSSFSWRRLRSKNSAATLGFQGRYGSNDTIKDSPNLSTLPMTSQPTSRPVKRDMSQAQFTGPNAHYMGSLARLFDAVQVIDQIGRQVDDPGLRHADKTQVGLELCTRHAAEFFSFYVCRFVLTDLGMLMDKFIKRGSEWVLT